MQQFKHLVFVLRSDGTETPLDQYQTERGFSGAQIAKHFKFTEAKFMQDLQDYGRLVVCELLMNVADKYRDLKGAPVKVNSFNRSRAKQIDLQMRGFKAAATSPHEYYLAMDVDTDTEHETRLNAAMIKQAAKQLGIKVRIGFEQYLKDGMTFIHFDVCPEYFGSGKLWHELPHPNQWDNEITW